MVTVYEVAARAVSRRELLKRGTAAGAMLVVSGSGGASVRPRPGASRPPV